MLAAYHCDWCRAAQVERSDVEVYLDMLGEFLRDRVTARYSNCIEYIPFYN